MFLESTPGNPPRRARHACLPKWRQRIYWAFRFGSFIQLDKDEAGYWDKCAIGEAATLYVIELTPKLQPVDDELEDYGSDFYSAVCNNNPRMALVYLSQIERRLNELDSMEV